jgi:hypothetical protein
MNNDDHTSLMDLSLPDNVSSVPTLHSSCDDDQVDGMSFRNVADRLALLPQTGDWYSRFTEQDWMQFQQVADMVLNALEPHEALSTTSEISDAFRCGFCHDVIVGATTLSCGCTICFKCWESENLVDCPSCQTTIEAAVPCHALDVAIAHVTHTHEANRRRDLLLAELIQQEEECLYKSKSTSKSTLQLFLGKYTLYVVLALLSAVRMSVLSRRA